MIGLIIALAPMLLKFIGSSALSAWIQTQKNKLDAANATERIKLERDIAVGEQELKRKQIVADLQVHELEHPLMWWGKAFLCLSVGIYWGMRFQAKIWGFDDWGVEIKDLASPEAVVSEIVLTFWFLSSKT